MLKIKVLFVTHKFPPAVGGMEKQCFELYNGIREDFEVILFRLKKESNRVLWLMTRGFRIKRILKKNPDITHVYFNDGLCGLGAKAVKKVSSAVTIVTYHGLDVVFPNSWFQRTLNRTFKDYVDHIIPVSNATGEECLARGADKNKITVVPNGVDLEIGNVDKDDTFYDRISDITGCDLRGKRILVSIGRSVLRKGFSWFTGEVLPGLDERYVYCMVGPRQKHLLLYNILFAILPRFAARQIILMGIGIDQNGISRQLKRPEIKNRAFQLGTLSHQDKIQILKHAHAFVMPNIKVQGDAEGFGLVALEAVLSGAPVVASNMEGITEAIVDGKNGALVESGNTERWIQAINDIPGEGEKREKLIHDAIKFSRSHYSWSKMVSLYKKVFISMK